LLAEDLGKAWRAQKAAVPFDPTMTFRRDGLVLGAGSILAPAEYDDHSRKICLDGREARLLALLSAAYGRKIDAGVLRHVRRGALRWSEGDEPAATLHLALTRLEPLTQPQEGERLFLAEVLSEGGAQPRMILRALGFDSDASEDTKKFFNPQQPRVPKGEPGAGQWVEEAIGWLSENGPRILGASRAALGWLGRIAGRLSAPTVFFSVLLIPSNKTTPGEEYDVPGHPGLRYARMLDEREWRIQYKDWDGDWYPLQQKPDGTLRDRQGRVIGRVLPGGNVAMDLPAIAPFQTKNRDRQACPVEIPDKFGQGPNSIARDYEDQVKRYINPEDPTPRGMGYALINLMTGRPVIYDDCQHRSGDMVEAKGPNFTKMLQNAKRWGFADSVDRKLLDQAQRQVQAASAPQVRRVRWFFADQEAADHARDLFINNGLLRIEVYVLPYVGRRK